MRIVVQQQPFDLGDMANGFAAGCQAAGNDMGAIVTFSGVVRDDPANPLRQMMIEHYPGMTEKALHKIAAEAQARWSLGDVLVIHRFGPMRPGEQIMMVATAARHRKDAFEAAEYLMDYLKSRAPFWKKEQAQAGAGWVAARDEDEDALRRW
ncbi:MAG: molybdenum cofactor biosynthesis protein MoaE [Rhodobacterales bacterium]